MAERLILRRPSLITAAETLYVPRRPRQKEKIIFICNPSTGNQKAKELAEQIAGFLPRSWEIGYKVSKDAGQEIGLAADGVKEEATIEVSVGGDGTLNGVVRGVTEELRRQERPIGEVAIANVHAGTVGNMDKESGRIRDPELIAFMLKNGIIRDMDLLRINNYPAVGVAGAGFDASRMKIVQPPGEKKLKTGVMPFLWEGAKGIIPYGGTPVLEAEIDGREIPVTRVAQVWTTSTRYSLSSFSMDGKSLNDDRKFEAYVIPGRGWQLGPRVAVTYALRGRNNPLAYCAKVNDYVRIKYAGEVDVEVDGTPIGNTDEIGVRLDPETICYLGPAHKMDMFGQDRNWDYSKRAEEVLFEAAA